MPFAPTDDHTRQAGTVWTTGLLLRQERDGSLVTHGDLKQASTFPAVNELVVGRNGYADVNGGGFDLSKGEEFAPGIVALTGQVLTTHAPAPAGGRP